METALIKTTLIDDRLLKTYSPIPMDFDIQSKMYPFILSAQSEIRKVIGDNLFYDLISQIESGEITDANKALIIEIAPAMATLSVYYALPSLWLSITQKGLTKEFSENSQSATKNELDYYTVKLKNQYDSHLSDLLSFLERCSDNYPLYEKSCKRRGVGDFLSYKVNEYNTKSNRCNCRK